MEWYIARKQAKANAALGATKPAERILRRRSYLARWRSGLVMPTALAKAAYKMQYRREERWRQVTDRRE